MRDVQAWLAQLPRDVAEQIAHRNGDRLFGSEGAATPAEPRR
jgi:hypothetical protein